MKLAGRAAAVLVAVGFVAVVAEHVGYLEIRREIVQDRQPILYADSAFHVVTLLALAPDQALFPAIDGFVEASEAAGATVVYAGQVAVVVIESRQIQLMIVGLNAINGGDSLAIMRERMKTFLADQPGDLDELLK